MCLPVTRQLWDLRDRPGTIEAVGGKALGLAALEAAGLPVPPAQVVPSSVYRRHVETAPSIQAAIDDLGTTTSELADLRHDIEGIDLNEVARSEIMESASSLRAPLAVRSSAAVEDSPSASWAGQFKTLLGVNHSAIPRSIARCWASLFTPEVAAYAANLKSSLRHGAMAVVIQELVRPVWAGVTFVGVRTSPELPPEDTVLVEAVRGMGEHLVSGASNPEVRIIANIATGKVVTRVVNLNPRRGCRVTAGRELPASVVDDLVVGLSQLRTIYGHERLDVEWGWDGTKVWFLQVRAIAFRDSGSFA